MKCDLCKALPYFLRILLRITYQNDSDTYIKELGLDSIDSGTGKQAVKHHKWGYTGKTGPDHWVENYSICGGRRQSPINIMTSEVEPVPWLTPFEFLGFDKISGHKSKPFLRMRNNGHTASMAVEDEMYVLGANLGDRYRTAEIHFHWGEDNQKGSEHGINHHHYPLEIHLVHYNIRYGNLSEAMKHPDGLAVIGVFADISAEGNLAFEHVTEALDKVTEHDTQTEVTGIRPMDLLPTNTHNYFHYEGSLTTPPCYESVLWFVMENKIKVSEGQIQRLRHLKEHVDEKHGPHPPSKTTNAKVSSTKNIKYILANFRPVQNLNGRSVYCSNASMQTTKMSAEIASNSIQSTDKNQSATDQSKHLSSFFVQGTPPVLGGSNTANQKGSALVQNKRKGTINVQETDSSVSMNQISTHGTSQSQSSEGFGTSNMISPKTNAGKMTSNNDVTNEPSKLTIDFVNSNSVNGKAGDKNGNTIEAVGMENTIGFNGMDRQGMELAGNSAVDETASKRLTKEVTLDTPSYGYRGKKYGDAFYGSQKQSTTSTIRNGRTNPGKNALPKSLLDGSQTGGKNEVKKAQILKFFANMLLKQAVILQRMQEQKVAQRAALNQEYDRNVPSHSAKIFSNPSVSSTSRIEIGISGFDNGQAFNRRGIGFVQPASGNVQSELAKFDTFPVSIETPSWRNPPNTSFIQEPKDYVQRQHLTYYDPLDRPINQRSIIIPPVAKYNVIDPLPKWPLHVAPPRKTAVPSKTSLDAFFAETKSKPKRRGVKRKGSHKNKAKRRKWIIDLLADYVKLMDSLTKQ